MTLSQAITLNNDVEMPILGLGTWQSASGTEAVNAVKAALDLGYRHIDTAAIYRNEESVGQAIRESGVPREDIFVTTKLWTDDQGYDSALRAYDASLKRLGLDKVDMYLIHWPQHPDRRLDSWRALEKLYEEGRVRAIGVSNYMTHHLEELLANANTVPATNQIELHPYNFATRKDIVQMCRNQHIAITAYSPLARATHMDDPKLNTLAEKYDRTPAQVMLRWLVQQGTIVIPKSTNADRIEENSGIFDFEIDDEDMQTIMGFDESLVTTMDPMEIS
jgi:diketogulonate reductase-like aldo/keto reductase